jgi:hypothetical protein
MIEFLQSYGILIALGLLFLFMMRGHGHGGMGCGVGGHQHSPEQNPKVGTEEGQPKLGRHSSGCH